MKTASFLSVLAAGFLPGVARAAESVAVDVQLMTWNIRQATSTPGTGEELWTVRRPKVHQTLNFATASRPEALLCFQEVLYKQIQDLESDLGKTWTRVGVGRDDGVNAGEFSPIFFRSAVWELQENRTYWLSETPDKPSYGWGAAYRRILTVAHLRHRETDAHFVYMCTHFDSESQEAREQSALLVSSLATAWQDNTTQNGGDPAFLTPVFVGGDINSTPDNQAYKNMVAAGNMHDTRDQVAADLLYGHVNHTFSGFTEADSGGRIDSIFVKEPAGLSWPAWGVLENRFDDEIYASDHRPVVVEAQFIKGIK